MGHPAIGLGLHLAVIQMRMALEPGSPRRGRVSAPYFMMNGSSSGGAVSANSMKAMKPSRLPL